jgi:hypothetical protein
MGIIAIMTSVDGSPLRISSHLLSKNVKTKLYKPRSLRFFIATWQVSEDIDKGYFELGVEGNVWTLDGGNDRRLEKIGY